MPKALLSFSLGGTQITYIYIYILLLFSHYVTKPSHRYRTELCLLLFVVELKLLPEYGSELKGCEFGGLRTVSGRFVQIKRRQPGPPRCTILVGSTYMPHGLLRPFHLQSLSVAGTVSHGVPCHMAGP